MSKASKAGSGRPPMGKITNQQSRRHWVLPRRETNDFKKKHPTQTQLRRPERNKRPYKTSRFQLMGSSWGRSQVLLITPDELGPSANPPASTVSAINDTSAFEKAPHRQFKWQLFGRLVHLTFLPSFLSFPHSFSIFKRLFSRFSSSSKYFITPLLWVRRRERSSFSKTGFTSGRWTRR